MSTFSWAEYRQNTKSFKLEEPFDYLIYRPLAYLIVKLTYRIPLTPNHFSFAALVSAFIASYFMAQGTKIDFAIGGIFIVIFSTFDCCDGMLARMKKNGSKYGMQIDMFIDLISNIAFYVSLFIGMHQQQNEYPLEYLSFACAICILIHASIYNFYKKQFQFYSDGNPDGRKRELNAYKRDLENLNKMPGHYFEKLLLKLFLFFSDVQKDEDKIPTYDPKKYVDVNISLLPLWGSVAGSSHLTFLALALILNEMPIYLYFALVISNIWIFLVHFIQTNVNKSLLNPAGHS